MSYVKGLWLAASEEAEKGQLQETWSFSSNVWLVV